MRSDLALETLRTGAVERVELALQGATIDTIARRVDTARGVAYADRRYAGGNVSGLCFCTNTENAPTDSYGRGILARHNTVGGDGGS